MNCPKCKAAMRPLLVGFYCPNDCDKETPSKVAADGGQAPKELFLITSHVPATDGFIQMIGFDIAYDTLDAAMNSSHRNEWSDIWSVTDVTFANAGHGCTGVLPGGGYGIHRCRAIRQMLAGRKP